MSAYAQSAPGAGGRSEQYSLAKILGIWAAAALPMAALAWIVAPRLADRPAAAGRGAIINGKHGG